jgi:hypothetical protein
MNRQGKSSHGGAAGSIAVRAQHTPLRRNYCSACGALDGFAAASPGPRGDPWTLRTEGRSLPRSQSDIRSLYCARGPPVVVP